MPRNKKVRNATIIESGGIKYRSKLDARTHACLIKAGLNAEYEKYKFPIISGFETNDNKVEVYIPKKARNSNLSVLLKTTKFVPINYTPDFVIIGESGTYYIIECKGFPNDVYPYKRKLFISYLNSCPLISKSLFFEVHNQREIDQTISIIKEHESNYKNQGSL